MSCNPAYEPVEGSDSESAAQAVDVDEEDSEESSSTESDSGERQDNFRVTTIIHIIGLHR